MDITSLSQKFWARVEKGPGCWAWVGKRNQKEGYGLLHVRGGKFLGAHRYMWRLTYGDIPNGLCVCHHCDHPWCVNPEHLFLGTDLDNARDKARKGRARTHPRFGELNPAAKLTVEKVCTIRTLRGAGLPIRAIGKRVGAPYTTVWHVLKGTSWAWI